MEKYESSGALRIRNVCSEIHLHSNLHVTGLEVVLPKVVSLPTRGEIDVSLDMLREQVGSLFCLDAALRHGYLLGLI